MANSTSNSSSLAKWVLRLSLPLYLLCLMLPAVEIDKQGWQTGGELALFGIFGLISGHLSWLANAAFIIGWIQYLQSKWQTAFGFSLAALGLALSFLAYPTVLMSTAGTPSKIADYGPGYYVWLASMTCLAIGAYINQRKPA